MSRTYLYAAILVICASYAAPAVADYYHAFPIPKRFDYEPPATARMTVHRVSPLSVIAHCGWAYACTIGSRPTTGNCEFYFPKGHAAFFWRHERAHCNGWPPNHPYP